MKAILLLALASLLLFGCLELPKSKAVLPPNSSTISGGTGASSASSECIKLGFRCSSTCADGAELGYACSSGLKCCSLSSVSSVSTAQVVGTATPTVTGNVNVTPTPTVVPSVTCNDSDGGVSVFVKGVVSLGSGTEYADFCQDSSNVVEYWCDAGNWGSSVVSCPNGCSDGRCS